MRTLANLDLKKRYIFFFVLVSIVPIIIIMLLLYIPVKNLFKDEVIRSDSLKTRQLRDIMDVRTTEIYNIAVQISIDKRVKEFLYVKSPLDHIGNFYINDVSQIIKNYRAGNNFVSFIAIYFKQGCIVVTDEGKYQDDYFFENILRYEGMEPLEVKELMSRTYYNEYLPIKNISSAATINGKYVTYIQSIPIGEKNAPVNIIMLIEEKNMLAMVGETNIEHKRQLTIVKEDGEIIFSKGGGEDLLPEILQKTFSDEGSYVLQTPGLSSVVVSYAKSNAKNWIYVVITNMDSIISKVNKIRNFTILIVLIAVAIAVSLSVMMADLSYSPWKNLTKYITSVYNKTDNNKKYEDEYRFAIDTIENLLSEKRKLQDDMDKNQNYMMNNILMNICTGKVLSNDLISKIEVFLPYKLYCVIMADFESSEHLKMSISQFIFRYIGIFYSGCRLYSFIDEKERLCLVLNITSYDTNTIIQKIKHVRDAVSNHFGITIYIGVGNVYEGVDKLHITFKESKKSLEYCLLKGNDPVVYFPEIEKYIFSSLNLPVHSGNPLLNSVKIGDFNTCFSLLNEYFENIVNNAGDASVHYMYCLFYNFVGVILKACEEINVDFEVVFKQSPEQILDIDKYRNSRQMIDSVYSIYRQLCDYVQNNKSSQNISLKKRIEKILYESYSNKNFSLVELADNLGYSSSYLSRFIKQEFGTGFGDLLNNIRLEKAKHMLSAGLKQIGEISDAAGYTSINSFIRTFKRVEGITPKQYRDMMYAEINAEKLSAH
ncbi:MAG: AraC family transcriptional regulator [Firmicutes bacterium]|nr:AraC family transcriptional regulator [Bacillota bacterium]